MPNEFRRAGKFWRDGHLTYSTASCFKESFEFSDIRFPQEYGIVTAASWFAQERTF